MASSSSIRIGWIGLGSMGLPMATNLQKHLAKSELPSLKYFNRTISRGEPLKEIGASPATSIQDMTSDTDLIFISLSDDTALEQVIKDMLEGDGAANLKGKTIVDTSTVHPNTSAKAETQFNSVGASFVASPVFGASPVAIKGELLFVLAGPNDTIELMTPFIKGIMGRAIIRLGTDVRQSSLLKTVGNFLTAGMMELIAEAHVFAEKAGLPPTALEDLIGERHGSLAYATSQRLTTGAYCTPPGERPWSDLQLGIKDVSHGISVAKETGSRLHIAEVALSHMQEAAQEDRPLDSASMYGILRRQAGLDFETEVVKKRDGNDVTPK